MNKNAQMEMIGLVFIVFLLAIGLLLMVSTTGKDNAKTTSINPQNIELSQNMIDAIKNIRVTCPYPESKKIGIDDLVMDMATDNRIYCSGQTSRAYTRLVISNILNQTLDVWGKSYYFTITKKDMLGEKPPYFIISNDENCKEGSDGSLGEQPFPLRGGGGTVAISLFICN